MPSFVCQYLLTRGDPMGIEFLTAMVEWLTDVLSDPGSYGLTNQLLARIQTPWGLEGS